MKMVDFIAAETEKYVATMPKEKRKEYGQFFTSKETATFMAEMFSISVCKQCEISVLDPGTGSGMLSAAFLDRLEDFPEVKTVWLSCWENDANILPLLRKNLEWMQQHTSKELRYELHEENYILSQEAEYGGLLCAKKVQKPVDFVIGNPPYLKIGKDVAEAAAMPDICYGAPNLYFLFAEMSAFNLREEGELVYIVPRSWTSGAYFKKFRQKFLSEMRLEQIHLFQSRDKVFESENVLQETMILRAKKSCKKPTQILITTTQSNADFEKKTAFYIPYSTVVNGENAYVYLVTNEKEAETLAQLNRWKDTLPALGLKMRTGITVDFRNRESLRNVAEKNAVPLFYPQHIQMGNVVFPVGKEAEYLVTTQKGLLQKNTNYLFVKRFTAKEEHRRLQCGVYLARRYPEYQQISTQNKINFICGLQGLSECVVYGLYVLFNSTIYDCYYRILNGSTQVNSTEINSMPVPPMKMIESMGKELLKTRDMSETGCDKILRNYL